MLRVRCSYLYFVKDVERNKEYDIMFVDLLRLLESASWQSGTSAEWVDWMEIRLFSVQLKNSFVTILNILMLKYSSVYSTLFFLSVSIAFWVFNLWQEWIWKNKKGVPQSTLCTKYFNWRELIDAVQIYSVPIHIVTESKCIFLEPLQLNVRAQIIAVAAALETDWVQNGGRWLVIDLVYLRMMQTRFRRFITIGKLLPLPIEAANWMNDAFHAAFRLEL